MIKTPKRLEKDAIAVCMVQIRFDAKKNSELSSILPGILFSQFKETFKSTRATHEAEIPKSIRENDLSLKFQPTSLLIADDFMVGIGDHSVTITFQSPYKGWNYVEETSSKIIKSSLDTELVENISRVSVLYHNILGKKEEQNSELAPLELNIKLGKKLEAVDRGTVIRREFDIEDTISIVEIKTGAKADLHIGEKGKQKSLSGVLLTVDTIMDTHILEPSKNFDKIRSNINHVHEVEKTIFFELLKENTLKEMKPIWE